MMKKNITIITALAISIMLLAANGFSDVPAPPVNQYIGMPDGTFNDLTEADCRACHDDPASGGPSNSDRHHLLYNIPIFYGACSVNGNSCLTDEDCDTLICESYGNACSVDADCPGGYGSETCGEVCVGETAATNPESNTSVYTCVSCHTLPDDDTFFAESDCLVCHSQVDGEASVHHLTGTAQGTDSPLGDPTRGDCTPCHGTIVDDYGDGHTIPTYEPTEQTPSVKNGTGLPLNSEGNGAGACNYCHTTGTGSNDPGTDAATGILVYSNTTTHHSSGVYRSRTGAINSNNCSLCHSEGHLVLNIRTCEQCHGYESLHSIQADSNGDGEIVVGEEDYGFGHVGTDNTGEGSDCWGCHGFSSASTSTPGTGPVTPYLSDSTENIIIAGKDKTILLSGSSLTNTSGITKFESIFTLIAQDGSFKVLAPFYLTASKGFITIPGETPTGNYKLRANKFSGTTWVKSNPLSISIKNPAVIWVQSVEQSCGECSGELTVWGSGFGKEQPEGSEEFMNVMQNGEKLNITYWKEPLIKATGADCDGSEITVNGLFGSATK